MSRRPKGLRDAAAPLSQATKTVHPGRVLLSLFLSVAMVFSTVPAQAFAEAVGEVGSNSSSSSEGTDAPGGNSSGQGNVEGSGSSPNATGNENDSGGGTSESGLDGEQNQKASTNDLSDGQNLQGYTNDNRTADPVDASPTPDDRNQSESDYDQTPVTFFRLRNEESGQYRYTSSADERDSLAASGWVAEGTSWQTPTSSETPVYALVDDATGAYTFTTSKDQYDASSLSKKGIAFYSVDVQ